MHLYACVSVALFVISPVVEGAECREKGNRALDVPFRIEDVQSHEIQQGEALGSWKPFLFLSKRLRHNDEGSQHTGRTQWRPSDPSPDNLSASSAVVPYEEPICLAHDTPELLQWCHILHAFGIRHDSTFLPDMDTKSKTSVVADAGVFTERESESEEWKQRFESLDRFREQLKNASIKSESINEIIESIESDDVGEWINLAASSAGAKIVGSNPEARNPLRVIDGKKETFMKSDCKADQWLIIELSHAAKIKMIEMTMKELYSPRVAGVRVYGRMSSLSKDLEGYPSRFESPRWNHLTELKPENRKGTQHFTVISHGLVKYLGVQIIKYHGMGTACTINDISVYGLSPVNNLESLLEEAVHDENGSQEQASQQHEDSRGHDRVNNGMQESSQSHHLRQPTGQEAVLEVAEPSLISFLEVEQQQETTASIESEDMKKEHQEDAPSKRAPKNVDSIASLSTFRKMHQDVQTLKGSTTVLSQYVDELHGGLMQTIDELWKSQKTTKTQTDKVLEQLRGITTALERLQNRIELVEEEQTASVRRAQMAMGIMGFCVSFIGLSALKSSSFSKRSSFFTFAVFILCCLNFAVSFLNLVTVVSPALLINLSKLMRPIWNPSFSR